MSASRATKRARYRAVFTGETHQQARSALSAGNGDDAVVPDASHPDQQILEASVLTELHNWYAPWTSGEHGGQRSVLHIERVEPSSAGLRLHPATEHRTEILDLLLPDIEMYAGIPGLRLRFVDAGAELYHLDLKGRILIPLGRVDASRRFAEEMPESVVRQEGWASNERARWNTFKDELGDVAAKSRVLRRLLAFADYPFFSLLDGSAEPALPVSSDFEQIARARLQRTPRAQPTAGRVPAVASSLGPQHRVAAVVGPRRLGGVGRSLFTAGLAVALAEQGRSVLVVDADFASSLGVGEYLRSACRSLGEGATRPDLVTLPEGTEPAHALDVLATVRDDVHHDVVLVDVGPFEQAEAARRAGAWIGLVPMWHHHRVAELDAIDPAGRRLPDGWRGSWLEQMRAHRWQVETRLFLTLGTRMFEGYDPATAIGLVITGVDGVALDAARADLADVADVPILHAAIPPLNPAGGSHGRRRAKETITRAYQAVARELTTEDGSGERVRLSVDLPLTRGGQAKTRTRAAIPPATPEDRTVIFDAEPSKPPPVRDADNQWWGGLSGEALANLDLPKPEPLMLLDFDPQTNATRWTKLD